MYATKYDEEFTSYLPNFVEDVWNLLTSLGPQQKYDIVSTSFLLHSIRSNFCLIFPIFAQLVTNALTFLSTVADRKQYQHLFENPTVLKSICEKVVFPNIEFRSKLSHYLIQR